MESLIDESCGGARARGISLTPTTGTGGSQLENGAEEAVASSCRRRRGRYASAGFPYPATIFCLSCIVCSVTTTRASISEKTVATSSPISQTTPGDVLLLKALIHVISQNRIAMSSADSRYDTQSGAGGQSVKMYPKSPKTNGRLNIIGSSNYSKDILIQSIYEKAIKYHELKSQTGAPPSGDGGSGSGADPKDAVQYNNNVCPYNDMYMQENEGCDAWKAFIFEYLFPWVLVLAILGNALTLAVYRSRYLKSAATVLLLAVKAQANLAFACCLSMEMLHYFLADDSPFQDVYWRSRPYTLFLANYFDSLAVWCTLAITLETYICVSFPMSFRRWSKRRTIYVLIVCLMIASGLLHVAYPITREVERYPSCPPSHRYGMITRDGGFYSGYERVYFFLHALAVISLPVLLMAIFSVLIGYHFNRKPMGQRFSERRRCVLRITFATTLCTLVLQTPGLVVFAAAAIRGSTLEENFSFCTVNVVTTFLTTINAAAPFLVYLCLNETFRRLLFVQLGSRFIKCRLCRRCYECENQMGNVGEITEGDQSHYALSPVTVQNALNNRRSGSRHRLEEEEMVTNHTRLTPSYRHKEQDSPSPIMEEEPLAFKNPDALLREGEPAQRAATVRIVVEDVM